MKLELLLPTNQNLDEKDRIMVVHFMNQLKDCYLNEAGGYVCITEKPNIEESDESPSRS